MAGKPQLRYNNSREAALIRRLLVIGLLSLTLPWPFLWTGAAQAAAAPDASPQLVAAAKSGDTARVASLLHKGANPNSRDVNGVSVLEWASANGHVETVKTLLKANAKVDGAYNSMKITPLFRAAGFGFSDVVELLIAHGANVNQRALSGYTPLDYAVFFSKTAQTAATLKRHGAVRGTPIGFGYPLGTPLDLCKVSAGAGFFIDKSAWTAYPKDPAQFYCIAGKHGFPGGAGEVVMYTLQVDGNAGMATSVMIRTQIYAQSAPKKDIGETLGPLLAAIYAELRKGPVPGELTNAIGNLTELRQNTGLGLVTATYLPGRNAGSVSGSEYRIVIQLH